MTATWGPGMVPAGRRRAARPRWRDGWYAAGLLVLAPFLAETVASANTPAVLFPVVLPIYLVVYGCPALLARELWVRGRLTALRVVALGVGCTAFNEGLVAATWFKLSPAGRVLAFTATQAGHAAGVNWAVAVNLVAFHTVYSLMIPVTLAQAVAVTRGSGADRRPWLGRRGAIVCTVLLALVVLGSLTPRAAARTCAGPALGSCTTGRAAAAALAVLVALALALLPTPRSSLPHGPAGGTTPEPAPAGRHAGARRLAGGLLFGLAFFGSYFGLPLLGLPAAAAATGVLLVAVAAAAAVEWSRPGGADPRAELLRALGALLPGMAFGLVAWRVGQPLAVLLAVGLFVYLLRRLPSAPPVAGSP